MNEDHLQFSQWLRTSHQIRWDEISSVETNEESRKLVFSSSDERKRLSIPAPQFWDAKYKDAMEKRLAAELQKRGLKIVKTGRADYLESKNKQV